MLISRTGKPPIWLAKLATFSKELKSVRWPVSPAAGILEGCRLSDLGQTIFRATLRTQCQTACPDELAALRESVDAHVERNLRRVFSRTV
jgi:hypothetical protein